MSSNEEKIASSKGGSIVTDKVNVIFSNLAKPDTYLGKEEYNITAIFTEEQVKALRNKFKGVIDKVYDKQLKIFSALDEDEQEELGEPKRIGLRFKISRGKSIKNEEGEVIKKGDIIKGEKLLKFGSKFSIPIFDIYGQPLDLETLGRKDNELWGGDLIKISFKGKVTYISNRNEVAAVLYLTGVQFIKKGGEGKSTVENAFGDESEGTFGDEEVGTKEDEEGIKGELD